MGNCKVEHYDDNFSFCAEERETTITMDDSCNTCTVFTRQRTIMTKLRKLGIEPIRKGMVKDRVVEEVYSIPAEYIQIRKPKQLNLSEEQKKEIGERLHRARK